MLEPRLLQVFDEIYKGRSVTGAAEVLGIGQPAVSVALAKLREHYGDQLFVRIGNVMAPTPLARELAQSVRQALDALARVHQHRAVFEPAGAVRRFRICMSDISQLALLPRLLPHLRRHAPGVSIEILPHTEHTPRMLASGEVDLVFGYMPELEAGFFEQTLFHQNFVCLASRQHPRIAGALSLAQYEAEEHAAVALSSAGAQTLERELARQGVRQKVAFRVPNYIGIAFVIEQTDLLLTVPEGLVEILADRAEFQILPVPFEIPSIPVKQHWHERYHADPGNCWLRQSIYSLVTASPG